MTFEEFQATRKRVDDLSKQIDQDELLNKPGYLYCDGFYIEIEPNGQFYCPVGNSEMLDDDLAKVERFLWDQFAKYEMNGPDAE